MTIKLQSPHPFAERWLLFGGGGAGKTNCALNTIQHCADGEMFVCEHDFSMAYVQALATDFTDVVDRVHVSTPEPYWEPYTKQLAEVCKMGNPEKDWLVIDSISPTWEMCQDWYLFQIYGDDFATHMIKLRAEYKDDMKAFAAARSADMNWPDVKKEYASRVYRPIQAWHGNLIITAEAKKVSGQDSNDIQMEFGPIGYKPSGESRLMYVAASNIFLDHPKRGLWRMTTTKNRNREELDKAPVDDFAVDFLQDIAGWEMVRKAK